MAAAGKAFEKWRLVPAPRRAEIIFRAASILEKRKEQFARDMTREMGKVLKETRGDIQEAIDTGYYMAGEGRRLFGFTTPSELPNKFAMCVRQPVGVCAMITPWNFPMAIPSWKLFPALVAGNTCVIKPAQDTPLSVFNFVAALTEAGSPGRRGQHRHRLRQRSRRPAGGASPTFARFRSRARRRWAAWWEQLRRASETLLAGAGRQEPDDRAR